METANNYLRQSLSDISKANNILRQIFDELKEYKNEKYNETEIRKQSENRTKQYKKCDPYKQYSSTVSGTPVSGKKASYKGEKNLSSGGMRLETLLKKNTRVEETENG